MNDIDLYMIGLGIWVVVVELFVGILLFLKLITVVQDLAS